MSPSANARTAFDEREQHDQLNVIFEVIGTPSEDVIAGARASASVRPLERLHSHGPET
jgi:hypothetical protein